MKNRGFLACASAIFLAAASPASAQQSPETQALVIPAAPAVSPGSNIPPWMNAWAGVGITNSYQGAFAGFTTATNPERSLWLDTWLVRMDIGGGQYRSIFFGGLEGQTETHSGDFLIGYRKYLPNGSLTLYAGPAWEFHNNSDPAASIRGGEGGVKGILEHELKFSPDLSLGSGAAYSTAFSTYYAYTQLGYKLNPTFTLGPEVSFFGNEAPYREIRAGAFVRFDTVVGQVTLSGGYRDPLTDSPSGYYVGFMVGRNYN